MPRKAVFEGSSGWRLIFFDAASDLSAQLIGLAVTDILVFRDVHSLANLLLLCFVQQIPAIFFSSFAGSGVNRWGARDWMLYLTIVKSVLVCALLFTEARLGLVVGYFCLVAAGLFTYVGQLSAVAKWIAPDQLIGFNALNERVALGLRIAGPVGIGWLVHQSEPVAALGTAFLFLIAAAWVIRGAIPDHKAVYPAPEPAKERHSRAIAGILNLRDDSISPFIPLYSLVLVVGGILGYGLPLYIKTGFSAGIAEMGLVLSIYQAGSFLGTLISPRWVALETNPGFRTGGAVLVSLFLVIFPQVPGYGLLFPCIAGIGFTLTILHICLESLIQRHAPKPEIGKIMAGMASIRGICLLAGTAAGAIGTAIWNPMVMMSVAGVLTGLTAAWIGLIGGKRENRNRCKRIGNLI